MRVTRLIYTCDVTQLKAKWFTYCSHDSFMYLGFEHVTHTRIESRGTNGWVMTHVWRCHSTHMNALPHTATHCNTLQHTASHCNTLQHTYECVTPHTWMPLTICMNEARHTNECVMTHTWIRHDTHSHSIPLQHTATHCNTLQNTATHCITLQHTATHVWMCHTTHMNASHCD